MQEQVPLRGWIQVKRRTRAVCVCARARVIQFLKVNAGIRIVGIPPEIMFLNCACACVRVLHSCSPL